MTIYLVNMNENIVVQKFDNVIKWSNQYVESLDKNNRRYKMYCNVDNEYFTDIEPIQK